MGLSPIEHLKAYRVNAGQSQIIFGVSGSTVNVVSALSLSAGGTYTSEPSVTISGGSGSNALAKASMGINSLSVTPQIVPTAVTLNAISTLGEGAVLTPVYGAPNISAIGNVFMNPNASPAPYISVASSPGSGASYQATFSVASVTIAQGSPLGAYTTAPAVSTTPASSFSSTLSYGYAGITKAVGAGQSDIFNYASGVPNLSATTNNAGATLATFQRLFRPRLFSDAGGASYSNLYWHTADSEPVVTQVGGWASGSSSTFTPKFCIHELAVDNVGSGYDDLVDIEADGTIIGDINFDGGTNELDPATITLTNAVFGYFSWDDLPVITLSPRGGGSGGSISISKCRLKKVEASGGSNYSAQDMVSFQSTGKLSATNLKNSGGSSANIDSDPLAMTVGQIYSVSIASEGLGYSFSDSITWSGLYDWCSLSAGVATSESAPALSSTKRLNGLTINNGGSFTTPPTFTVTAPATGNAPTITLASVLILSVANTNRGSGYGSTFALTGGGLFSDSGLTNSISDFDDYFSTSGPFLGSVSVVQPGTGYSVSDYVNFGYGNFPVASLRVSGLSIVNPGIGFSSAPSVSFSGGGQTVTATATASIAQITSSNSSFPLISASEADPNGSPPGDSRKVAYAICDAFHNLFSDGGAGVRVSSTRTVSPVAPNLDRSITYVFNFSVEKTGGYALKNE